MAPKKGGPVEQPPRRPPVVLADPKAIRALAHPARIAVIEELYSGAELTATECAEIAGMTPSAMSYHLRNLERAGIVERAESTGDGRERPWRAAGAYIQIESGSSTMGLAAGAALTSTVLTRLAEQLEVWSARKDVDPAWTGLGGVNSGQVWMMPDEAQELTETIFAMFDQFRSRATGDRPEGARRVRAAMFLFPVDLPAPS